MIDVARERLLTLQEASKLLPSRRAGRPTHPSTLVRWMDEGLLGIRLECLRVGANRCTTLEALQRFFERLTNAHAGEAEIERGECHGP